MRRSMGRRSNIGNTGGGPLMTGHLQDIDLELELLKRKREMIEQQQQLLVMEQQFKSSRHSYDQMRYDELEQHGSNRDFTHLYDTGPKHRNQFGKKRQAESQWHYEGPSKRSSSKKKSNQSQINQHGQGNSGPANIRNQRPMPSPIQSSKFSPKGPPPLMEAKIKPSIAQRIANQKPPPKAPHNKDFSQAKVSKPKATPAPNKLASHTVAERKSLVAAATESSTDGDVSRMLLPDRVPTQQVSGRLELALGAIMKNIRTLIDAQPQHAAMLRSIQLQRVMKQAVRERIRTVMLGKIVGSLLDILAVYREEFPEETDVDILNIALEAGGVSPQDRKQQSKFIESEDPGEFFKTNMSCLLENKLNEMFSKLEEIYGDSAAGNIGTTGDQIDLQKKTEPNKDMENSEEYKGFLNSNLKVHQIKRILPRLMKRYVPYIIKLINVDAMYQTTKAAITMKANQKAATIFSNKGPEEGRGDAENTAPASETSHDNRQMYNLPYYVKIMGRPTLPKRKVMQGFLSQFNPKSIKKHRTIHNLLFVGFTEKSDFDVMVGADGTVIGRSTLSVRICSKEPRESNAGQNGENNGTNASNSGQNNENNDTNIAKDISQDEVNKGDAKQGDLISAELDCQITDLLSSIRKSEEEDTKENTEKSDADNDNSGGEDKIQTITEQDNINSDEVKTEQEGDDNIKVEENINSDKDKTEQEGDDNMKVEEINQDGNGDADKQDNTVENVDDEETGDDNTEAQEKAVSDEAEPQNLEPANKSEDQDMEALNGANSENTDVSTKTQKSEETDITHIKNSESSDKAKAVSQETNKEETQMDTEQASKASERTPTKTEEPCEDKVGDLKSNATGRSTPSRMSARLANVTPSTIRTRRASRLAQQN